MTPTTAVLAMLYNTDLDQVQAVNIVYLHVLRQLLVVSACFQCAKLHVQRCIMTPIQPKNHNPGTVCHAMENALSQNI